VACWVFSFALGVKGPVEDSISVKSRTLPVAVCTHVQTKVAKQVYPVNGENENEEAEG
jgi:hypothetical protein